jgi:hypothetical protein
MFIVIGVLFLAVGIGVTVCILTISGLYSYCFKNTNRRLIRWSKHYATSWKVADSSLNEVIEFFKFA